MDFWQIHLPVTAYPFVMAILSLNLFPSVTVQSMGYQRLILVQNDDSVDQKIMGYKGVWVI